MKCRYVAGTIVFITSAKLISTLAYIDFRSVTDGIPHDEYPTTASTRTTTAPEPVPTLAHFDPYLMGGFRNQHMRFVAFVAHAVDRNISQILLPSLRWLAHYNSPNSIRHDLLFDVRYWNARAAELGLPVLVDYDPGVLEGIYQMQNESDRVGKSSARVEAVPCWNVSSGLFSGLDEAVLRHPKTNIRRIEVLEMIGQGEENGIYAHCRCGLEDAAAHYNCTIRAQGRFTRLIPHGGLKGNGRLWNEYMSLQRRRGSASEMVTIHNQSVPIYPDHVHVERAIFELLRPSKYLSVALEGALGKAMRNTSADCAHGRGCEIDDGPTPRVLALHPRVEPEMLGHRCARFMESNLTRVFERCEHFTPFLDAENDDGESMRGYRFNLVFIAVSAGQVLQQADRQDDLGLITNQNRDAFLHAREYGLFGRNRMGIPIFESGIDSAANVKFPPTSSHGDLEGGASSQFVSPESLGVLELVASIINFFTAVKADIFVGVRGSSFSTDVFSVRYYQHKNLGRLENYIIGPDGIHQLHGPPPPHSCN
ncbi:hypothetical protein ACHAW5_007346 [Stephanodiscus triporus]|uniref:Uncharacterized protein n=1 Tax=Stephanodiscus triporus TaxID=2934178 RepID=A0ABD3N7P4_9STRA